MFLFVTAAAGTAQGAPPVKPKRKKPGTAVKRKVQPIAVDAKGIQSNRQSNFPLAEWDFFQPLDSLVCS